MEKLVKGQTAKDLKWLLAGIGDRDTIVRFGMPRQALGVEADRTVVAVTDGCRMHLLVGMPAIQVCVTLLDCADLADEQVEEYKVPKGWKGETVLTRVDEPSNLARRMVESFRTWVAGLPTEDHGCMASGAPAPLMYQLATRAGAAVDPTFVLDAYGEAKHAYAWVLGTFAPGKVCNDPILITDVNLDRWAVVMVWSNHDEQVQSHK